MNNEQPIPCPCGGFWPDDHVKGCTSKEMSKLWPRSYAQELRNEQHPAAEDTNVGSADTRDEVYYGEAGEL